MAGTGHRRVAHLQRVPRCHRVVPLGEQVGVHLQRDDRGHSSLLLSMTQARRSRRRAKAATQASAAIGRIGRLSGAAEERLFDRAAHHYLGMSGQDFLRKWRAGEFMNPDAHPAVRHVAMLRRLAESTPATAVAEFLGPLRQTIACVTRARVEVSADGYRADPTGPAHRLFHGAATRPRCPGCCDSTALTRGRYSRNYREPWRGLRIP